MSTNNGFASLDDLVVGINNAQAFKAVKDMVTQFPKPGVLLLYGPSGSGKTALFRAAITETKKHRPEARVFWQPSADFISEMVSAIIADEKDAFRDIDIDLYVIDNLEDLLGKSATQGYLARKIADAYHSGAQVFLAANHQCKPLIVEKLLRDEMVCLTVVELPLPDQSTLERTWLRYEPTHILSDASGYIDFFRKSNVDNFWTLNGLLKVYLAKHNKLFFLDQKDYKH